MILSEKQLQQMVTPEIRQAIKDKYKDSQPVFKAYIAAHTGETISQNVSQGKLQPFKWLGTAISKIENFLGSKPVPFFHTHNQNRTEPLGESVSAGTFEQDGKIYSVCVAYIREKFRKFAETLDCISIECDVQHDQGTITDVLNVSAVAMDDSKKVQPAFAEAFELATLANNTAFVFNMQADAVFSQKQPESGGPALVNVMLTPREIKSMIAELELKPDQIFSRQQLVESASVAEHVNAQVAAQRAEVEKQTAELKRQAALAQWQAESQKILAAQNEPESFKKLFEAKKDQFSPSGDFTESAAKFVESVKQEHKKLSELGIIAEPKQPVQREAKRIAQPAADPATDRLAEYFK